MTENQPHKLRPPFLAALPPVSAAACTSLFSPGHDMLPTHMPAAAAAANRLIRGVCALPPFLQNLITVTNAAIRRRVASTAAGERQAGRCWSSIPHSQSGACQLVNDPHSQATVAQHTFPLLVVPSLHRCNHPCPPGQVRRAWSGWAAARPAPHQPGTQCTLRFPSAYRTLPAAHSRFPGLPTCEVTPLSTPHCLRLQSIHPNSLFGSTA